MRDLARSYAILRDPSRSCAIVRDSRSYASRDLASVHIPGPGWTQSESRTRTLGGGAPRRGRITLGYARPPLCIEGSMEYYFGFLH
eukprot:gene7657-biopygen1792